MAKGRNNVNVHQQMHEYTKCGIYMYIYTMEQYSALKNNTVLICASTWMNFGNVLTEGA